MATDVDHVTVIQVDVIQEEVMQMDEAQLDAAWQLILDALEAKKAWLLQEMSYYRPPIPACDAQFNYLLEARATLVQEIGQVQAWRKARLTPHEQRVLLEEFVQQSHHLSEAVKTNLRDVLAYKQYPVDISTAMTYDTPY